MWNSLSLSSQREFDVMIMNTAWAWILISPTGSQDPSDVLLFSILSQPAVVMTTGTQIGVQEIRLYEFGRNESIKNLSPPWDALNPDSQIYNRGRKRDGERAEQRKRSESIWEGLHIASTQNPEKSARAVGESLLSRLLDENRIRNHKTRSSVLVSGSLSFARTFWNEFALLQLSSYRDEYITKK